MPERRGPSEAAEKRATIVNQWQDAIKREADDFAPMQGIATSYTRAIQLTILTEILEFLSFASDTTTPRKRGEALPLVVPLDLVGPGTAEIIRTASQQFGHEETVRIVDEAKIAAAQYLLDENHLGFPYPRLSEALAAHATAGGELQAVQIQGIPPEEIAELTALRRYYESENSASEHHPSRRGKKGQKTPPDEMWTKQMKDTRIYRIKSKNVPGITISLSYTGMAAAGQVPALSLIVEKI